MEVSPVLEDFRYYLQMNLFLDVSFKKKFQIEFMHVIYQIDDYHHLNFFEE